MKPIIFNTEMVLAILEGRKTQTRRLIVVNDPDNWTAVNRCRETSQYGASVPCYLYREAATEERGIHYPRYDIGDTIYVRETWQRLDQAVCPDLGDGNYVYVYRANENGLLWEGESEDWQWRPSIHMPKEAARVFLRVTGVWVERYQDITTADAIAEGFSGIGQFRSMFDRYLTKKDGSDWYTNPWVWVVEFKYLENFRRHSHERKKTNTEREGTPGQQAAKPCQLADY